LFTIYVLVLVYLLMAIWNSTLGGFLGAKILPFVFVGYALPSYSDGGIPIVSPGGPDWRGSWPAYWGQ
jgi:hypothetical protein